MLILRDVCQEISLNAMQEHPRKRGGSFHEATASFGHEKEPGDQRAATNERHKLDWVHNQYAPPKPKGNS